MMPTQFTEQASKAEIWMRDYHLHLISLGCTPQGTGAMADCLVADAITELPKWPQAVFTELPTSEGKWNND